MSEGRSSPATLHEQRRPTRRHVNLLHEIILRAQQDPLVNHSPKDALLDAYATVFEEHNLAVQDDNVCFWTLLKIFDPGIVSGSLYEKFENVLKDEGIELSFDDDASLHGIARPVSIASSPYKIDLRHNAERYGRTAPAIRPSSMQSSQHPESAASAPSHTWQSLQDEDFEDYMDNPPPHIAQLMQRAEAMDRNTLLRQSLAVLKPRGVSVEEKFYSDLCERRLKERALSHWKTVSYDSQQRLGQADAHHEKVLKKKFLFRVLDRARAQRLRAMDEERLKGMALYKMTLVAREAYFQRKMEANLKQRYLRILQESLHKHQLRQAELETVARSHQAQFDLRPIVLGIEALRQNIHRNKELETFANGYHDDKLRRSALNIWYDKTDQIKQALPAADHHRAVSLMRRYLQRLREAAATKRNRRIVMIRWVLSRWRNFSEVKKHQAYDDGYKRIRKLVKMNLARRLMRTWADKTRAIQDMENQASQIRVESTNRVAHNAVVFMYENSQQIQEFEATADTHANERAMKRALTLLTEEHNRVHQIQDLSDRMQTFHTQQVAAKCLKQMNMKSFEVRRRERDVEAFQRRHEKRILRGSLGKMSIAASQRRGEEPLRLPPATPSQRRAEEINRLTLGGGGSTTPLYTPATRASAAAARISFAARLRGEIGGQPPPHVLTASIAEEVEPSEAAVDEEMIES